LNFLSRHVPPQRSIAPEYYTIYRKGFEIGDGVHIATGNYTKSFIDLNISLPGVKFDFVRTYNSMNYRVLTANTIRRS